MRDWLDLPLDNSRRKLRRFTCMECQADYEGYGGRDSETGEWDAPPCPYCSESVEPRWWPSPDDGGGGG